MLGIPFLETAVKAIRPILYDDMVDRLNYYLTSLILIFFAILVSAKQYVGKPIQCWVPAQFRGGWEQYVEDYCFIQNTYFLPFEEQIPDQMQMREEKEIGYYQWVPIVLALQALMFFMPQLLWKVMHSQSGINLKSIMKMAQSTSETDPQKRKESVAKMANYIEDALGLQRDMVSASAFLPYRSHGVYMNSVYLFVKALYCINVVGQFFILNSFLGPQYQFWGVEILSDLFYGREWQNSGHFPRVTLCDFQVRELGNLHRHTVQCVLMINMFTEKIYLFLWFYLLLVGVITLINFIFWIFTTMVTSRRRALVMKFLRITRSISDSPTDRVTVNRFTTYGLRPDGVLILRFISGHAGDMVCLDLTKALWENFVQNMSATLPRSLVTKSSPGSKVSSSSLEKCDPGLVESLYVVDGKQNDAIRPLLPSAPNDADKTPNGYPGPPNNGKWVHHG